MTFTASDSWVVYSPNESAVSDSAGFWSNEFGWVPLDHATCFTTDEARDAMLPISATPTQLFLQVVSPTQGDD